jgi:adenylate kinase family enzyme
MANYDFRALNDKEFEALVSDLLSCELQVRFERFKAGRDGGIDARAFLNGGIAIVQCKHWARTSVAQLIRSLRKEELGKVQKLAPKRYILATSLELSAADKKSIHRIFAPFMQTDSDVFGYEDLNDLLGRHGSVERNHYKLWLHSSKVIETILNAPIVGRSNAFLEEVLEESVRYVETGSHQQAKVKLEMDGVVLITGEPGIGKTTLAKQLCLSYIGEKYALRVISGSLSEAEASFTPEEKVIFLMDDFLGRNYLEALEKQEDAAITGFIRRVTKDRSKRFILTSRSTVLNQAKRLSDLFNIRKIDKNEFELRIESLSRWDRARILYSHFWHSNLDFEYLNQIVENRNYAKLIEHKNFNPRLIEFIFDAQRLEGVPPNEFWNHVLASVQNPEAIWTHVFEQQLDDCTRAALLLVAFNGKELGEELLRRSYKRYLCIGLQNAGSVSTDFNRAMAAAVGSVLNRIIAKSVEPKYNLFNPSIGDFLVSRFKDDSDLLLKVFSALESLDSLQNIKSLLRSEVVSEQIIKKVILSLIRQKLADAEIDIDYRCSLAEIVADNFSGDQDYFEQIRAFIHSLTTELVDDECRLVRPLIRTISFGLENGLCDDGLIGKIGIDLFEFDEQDFAAVSHLLPLLTGQVRARIDAAIKPVLLEYLSDSFDNYVSESGETDSYLSEEDEHEVRTVVKRLAQEQLREFHFSFDAADVNSLTQSVDAFGLIYENQKRSMGEEREYREIRPVDGDWADIDNMFRVDLPKR